MRSIYSSETVLLVDASNAFNSLTRQVALRNIQHLCTALSTILTNTYRADPKLFIDSQTLCSCEGITQGDTLATMYAIGVMPLTSKPYKPMHEHGLQMIQWPVAELMTFLSGIRALRSMALALGTSSAVKELAGCLGRPFDHCEESLWRNWHQHHCGREKLLLGRNKGSSSDHALLPTLPQAAFTRGLSSKWTYFFRTIHRLHPCYNQSKVLGKGVGFYGPPTGRPATTYRV